MRCLYCGKPLPLLKKLTGGGEFCSDAHRHKYQEEYNKLALSRLLQAQSAPGEVGVFPTPGGGTGLRQLAAPAAATPIVGQRALPAPSEPVPPPTAHHQEERRAPQPPPRSVAPPPPPPLPPPQPDPKEGPFLIDPHPPVGPTHKAGILRKLSLSFESKPQFALEGPSLIPFEWESTASAIAASQEPDPPEAPAWIHPIEFHVPGEPLPHQAAAFEWELFAAKPFMPIQPEVSPDARFPQEVRPKISLPIETEAVRRVPGVLRFSPVRDWELNLRAPEWRPSFVAIGAPPPPPPVVRHSPSPASVAEPSVEFTASSVTPMAPVAPAALPPQTVPAATGVEVFVDLSALGIFE